MKTLLPFATTLFFACWTVSAQTQPLMVFWDEAEPCGRANAPLEPGRITCAVTQDKVSSQLKTFRHGGVSVSMTYWRFTDALRVVVVVENRGSNSIPVDVKLWNLTAFKSFESFEAQEKPLFMSKAERPLALVSRSELESVVKGSDSKLPSNDPLTTQTTERRVFNAETGRTTTERATKIVPEPAVPTAPITIRGKSGDSALKWTRIEPNSRSIGEVSFGTRSSAKFHLLSIDVDGVVYVYPLKPQPR